jgi:hypothetical protein
MRPSFDVVACWRLVVRDVEGTAGCVLVWAGDEAESGVSSCGKRGGLDE